MENIVDKFATFTLAVHNQEFVKFLVCNLIFSSESSWHNDISNRLSTITLALAGLLTWEPLRSPPSIATVWETVHDALTKIYPRYVRDDDMFTKKDGKSNIVEKQNFANSIDGFMVHSMLTKYSSKRHIILN